ncbi:MAG: family 1 glycosylhydrolase [Lachnospiraceae bacterium]|nr:family 1 glycosylhydrolase [Lachnospiraceae bacterium]
MEGNGFPQGFLWGAATASAQVEGGWNEGGRTPSIWDVASPKKIKHGENCHTASDHFHHWKEDVALMKEIGLKSYRFSVSWSRVMPEEGKINPEGIAFYKNLVHELVEAGIEPLVTIYHWDMPVWVHKMGGWRSKKIVPLFEEYTKVVVDALSDQVTWWMTMNEPQCFILNGYMAGQHAPFEHAVLEMSKILENTMLAHAAAANAIRANAKKPPKVGIAMATGCFVPENETPEAIQKSYHDTFEKGMGAVSNALWMEPMLAGRPSKAFGVYKVNEATAKAAHVPLDFVGINVYQPMNTSEWGGDGKPQKPGAPKTAMGWTVDGRVLYWTARFLYERYHLPIMVTENGMAENDFICLDGKVHDGMRIDFLHRYLRELKRACDEGIPVLGYQHWSLMDNFEWAEGYDPRFGLIYVDFETGKRTLKDSAYEYAEVIRSNGSTL